MSSKSHSRSIKESGKRSFTINHAYHVDGCPTKFSHKDYTGRFIKRSAQRAAMAALTELCHVKKIRGRCALYIEMRETTQGSGGKLFAYHCKRIALKPPVEINGVMHYYKPTAKPVANVPTEKCPKSHKSSGRMVGIHSKKLRNKHHLLTKSRTTKKTPKFSNTVKKSVLSIKKSIKKLF